MPAFTIYWAGGLFDFKELCGNLALADAVAHRSGGRYHPFLPQDSESNALRGTDIRDRDLEMLFRSDLIVANFDGTDLDSGTAVEFFCAKMLDLPAVLLRTDFRHCGDQQPGSDPWNLMCSGYPRSASLHLGSMGLYHRIRNEKNEVRGRIGAMVDGIAEKVIAELDRVRALPSLFGGDAAKAEKIYRWTADCCGASFRKIMTDGAIAELVAVRAAKNLI